METSERGPREATGASGALDVLLEQALRGDEQALHILIELLQTEHYRRFIASLKRLATSAHTQTIEDVVQESLIGLIEKIRAGELRDLSPGDRADFLGYFQRILDGALRNAVRASIRQNSGSSRAADLRTTRCRSVSSSAASCHERWWARSTSHVCARSRPARNS